MAPGAKPWVRFGRQCLGLTKKHFLLRARAWQVNLLQLFQAVLFVFLIWAIDRSVGHSRLKDPAYQDLSDPHRTPVGQIPNCRDNIYLLQGQPCFDFLYSPAGNAVVNQLVSGIRDNNEPPISADRVMGLANTTMMDDYLLAHPQSALASVAFDPTSASQMNFVVQTNTTVQWFKGTFQNPNSYVQLPLQMAVEREITRYLTGDLHLDWDMGFTPFPHPALQTASTVGSIAPTFLFASAMFNVVLLLYNVVLEKESGVRQAMTTMGLWDSAFWLTWAAFEGLIAVIHALLICVVAAIFQFDLVLRNSFGLVFVLLLMTNLALTAFAFVLSAFLRKASSSVTVGFVLFIIAWIFLLVIAFGFPYNSKYSPAGYILFSLFPWSLLGKGIQDLAVASTGDKAFGIGWSQQNDYCVPSTPSPAQLHQPGYVQDDCVLSIGQIFWVAALQYVGYMALAVYCDQVLPDRNGVRRLPWYLLRPSHFCCSQASNTCCAKAALQAASKDDARHVDDDVRKEAQRMRLRCQQYVLADHRRDPSALATRSTLSNAKEVHKEEPAEPVTMAYNPHFQPSGTDSADSMHSADSVTAGSALSQPQSESSAFASMYTANSAGTSALTTFASATSQLPSAQPMVTASTTHVTGSTLHAREPSQDSAAKQPPLDFPVGAKPPPVQLPERGHGRQEGPISRSSGPDTPEEDISSCAQATHASLDPADLDKLAVEIFGLRKVYRASRWWSGCRPKEAKEFVAVHGNWLGIKTGECFCIIGPNGAGKTSTINCLTGVTPMSGGDALINGRSIATAVGLAAARGVMGVCPQFDVLWDSLTGREHLLLFGAVKGLPREERVSETDALLAQVGLEAAASVRAGAYSGGMRRRLSVAIALLGQPKVLFLDEPTTGMDPVSRRYLWELIAGVKSRCAVVLTTHSMEEADVLGDRIAVIARGRLQCLGSGLHLKQRFGSGYRVAIQLGSKGGAEGALHAEGPGEATHAAALHALVAEHLGVATTEEDGNAGIVHFAVPPGMEDQLPSFFSALKAQKAELGVRSVQVRQAPLEEVFLAVTRDAELEQAKVAGQTTRVALEEEAGIVVEVPIGAPLIESPGGLLYHLKWVQDENGRLVLNSTHLSAQPSQPRGPTNSFTAPNGTSLARSLMTSPAVAPVAEAPKPAKPSSRSRGIFWTERVRKTAQGQEVGTAAAVPQSHPIMLGRSSMQSTASLESAVSEDAFSEVQPSAMSQSSQSSTHSTFLTARTGSQKSVFSVRSSV